jgi:MFS family permease
LTKVLIVTGQINKNLQYYKFCLYGFLKNLRFFDAFFILFFLEKDLSYTEIGLLYSIREITLAITEIPSGVIADMFGRRKTLIVAFFFYILSFVVFFLSDQFLFFAAAMLLFAFGDAFRTGVHKAMIYDYLVINHQPKLKVTYYGHTRSWSQTGTAISALIAGIIVFYSGRYDIIFLASGIPYLLDMINIWSYPKYLDGKNASISLTLISNRFVTVLKAFVFSFRNLYFLRLLTNSNMNSGLYSAMKDYIQPLLKMLALSAPVLLYLSDDKKIALITGITYFITYLITAVLSRNSGRFVKFFKTDTVPMNLTVLGTLITGILTGIAFSMGYYILAIVGFIVILSIENLRKPIGVAMVSDLTKDEAMATVLSASSQFKSIIAAIIAPLLGWLADLTNPGTGIMITSLILILFLPFYWLIRKKPIQ